jgi:hypothetical protein
MSDAMCASSAWDLSRDFYEYCTRGLGITQAETTYAADPGVKSYIQDYGAEVVDWLYSHGRQKLENELAMKEGRQPQLFQQTYRRILVLNPRETMKSAWVTQGTPPFCHNWDKDIAIAISSASHQKMAQKFMRPIRKHWLGTSIKAWAPVCFGDFYARDRPFSVDAIETAKRTSSKGDPTLSAYSVEVSPTSGHFDLYLWDDPVTKEQLEKYGEGWFDKCWDHFLSLDYVVAKTGMLVIVMTRYSDDDPVGRIVRNVVEPAVKKQFGKLPDDFNYEDGWVDYAHLAGWKVIQTTATKNWDEFCRRIEHLSMEDIEKKDPCEDLLNYPLCWPTAAIADKVRKDPLFAVTQLENKPTKRSDRPIKPIHVEAAWIEAADVPSKAWMDVTMHMDLAFKSREAFLEQRGDYNVIQIWGHHEGHVYLLWGWRGKVTQDMFGEDWIRALQWVKLEKSYKPRGRLRLMTYDKPVGSDSGEGLKNWFLALAAENGHRCPRVIELPRRTKKTDKMMATAGFWQDGRIHLVRGVPGSDELSRQALMLGSYMPFDDDLDASADVFCEEAYKPPHRTFDDVSTADTDDEFEWEPAIPMQHQDSMTGDDWEEAVAF